ncbi:UDP-N-acetylmuramate dehydrogenase [Larsenimonas rhizosphaerae]|uniref:UDP-N-acetylenolpyruvoylglucosamine reductase n=1 Tax=Larsenimonas rhizosphaerae TaxID=2944682 RepID=A0AA41ZF53_9GAMM|nr:UDP-N-acetylmuramate dehydrogenase [Larsenimonas rhizosphaerae]MCX2523677.1 UDP-N-acetylmuramate dehydrogenase [Larsenimonas rhizosphaerae]
MMRQDIDLAARNTLRLPARAQWWCEVDTIASLRDTLAIAQSRQWRVRVLGGGSNVILPSVVSGLVLRYTGQGCWFGEWLNEADRLLHVEAGIDWHALVLRCCDAGWWGIENLALIPGTTGAAPVQNIGAYGVELSDVVHEVHLIELESGAYRILSSAQCLFGYRDSIFKQALAGQVVIVRVVLRLSRTPSPRLGYQGLTHLAEQAALSPRTVADAVTALRRSKLPDPADIGNAGSFFKNPIVSLDVIERLKRDYPSIPIYPVDSAGAKVAAAWLIDQCGLKGLKWPEGVGIHDRQALVLTHDGRGNAEDVLALSDYIAETVQGRFGVVLEREPGFWGELPAH